MKPRIVKKIVLMLRSNWLEGADALSDLAFIQETWQCTERRALVVGLSRLCGELARRDPKAWAAYCERTGRTNYHAKKES